MFNKLGQGLRWLGEKTSTAASWLGHKVGGALTAISPAVAHFNPTIGTGLASAGMVMKGIGALGDAGKAMMRGGGTSVRMGSGGRSTGYEATRGRSGAPTRPSGRQIIR